MYATKRYTTIRTSWQRRNGCRIPPFCLYEQVSRDSVVKLGGGRLCHVAKNKPSRYRADSRSLAGQVQNHEYKTTNEKKLASFSMHSHPLLGRADEEEVGCITKTKTISEPKCRTFVGEEQKQMRRNKHDGFYIVSDACYDRGETTCISLGWVLEEALYIIRNMYCTNMFRENSYF